MYGEVAKVDPYNLDNMDTYSNILYVKVCTTFDYTLSNICSNFDLAYCKVYDFACSLIMFPSCRNKRQNLAIWPTTVMKLINIVRRLVALLVNISFDF